MRGGLNVIFVIMIFFGCAKKVVLEEFKSLMDNSGSASGSDLMLALCGWPTHVKPLPVSIDIELSSTSSRKEGEGIADISAKCGSFDCKAKISFNYSSTYVGGHGYSGGSGIQIGGLKRLDTVDPAISDPPNALPIKIGEPLKGMLDKNSVQLPDSSFAVYYNIELDNPNPLIRFNLEADQGLNPEGYVYQ